MMNDRYPRVIELPSFFHEGMVEHFQDEKPQVLNEFFDAKSDARHALHVMGENRKLIDQAEDVRRKNLQDPTITTAGANVKTYQFVKDKVLPQLYEKDVNAEQRLRDQISKIDNQISTPISSEARNGRFASEARAHVKSLPETERISFVRQAIENEDYETASFVLGGPGYLSGLLSDQRAGLTDEYKNKRYGKQMKVRAYLVKLADNIGKGHSAASKNLSVVETPEVLKALKLNKAARDAVK